MRARAAWFVGGMLAAHVASADPKPQPADVSAYRDQLIVLRDGSGGTYAVYTDRDHGSHLFYGTGTTLYEQIVGGRTFDGDAWTVDVVAPRVANMQNGAVVYGHDHAYALVCGTDHTPLTRLTGDKAKQALAKAQFMSPALVRSAHVLARDDSGVYYYVDQLRARYGGKGFRVFVGKKGAMKQLPLVDIASDPAGEVYSTKTGQLRLVTSTTPDNPRPSVTWIKGDKRTQLVTLDVDESSPLIYRDLGVYTFIGTVCENI